MRSLRVMFVSMTMIAIVLAVYLSAVLVPATRWYEPRELLVVGQTEDGQPQVTLERKIHASFSGRYMVQVRWAEGRGAPSDPDYVEAGALACYGGDETNYKGGLDSPYTASLIEFTGDSPRCNSLPDGIFYVNVCWTVLRPYLGLVPPKEICVTSNPFRVENNRFRP